MSKHLLYTKLAKYYDVIYNDYLRKTVPRLVKFYEECFREYAGVRVKHVLDLACGTGGPTIELAGRGYSVVGVDVHREVLEIAFQKAKSRGRDIEFLVCDARDVDRVFTRASFDAVTMFFSSLNYMRSFEDLIRLLRSASRVLREEGVFVADVPNPYVLMYRLGASGAEKEVEGKVLCVEDGMCIRVVKWIEVADWRKLLVRFNLKITIDSGGKARSYMVSEPLRLYTTEELRIASMLAGFREAVAKCYVDEECGGGREDFRCSKIIVCCMK